MTKDLDTKLVWQQLTTSSFNKLKATCIGTFKKVNWTQVTWNLEEATANILSEINSIKSIDKLDKKFCEAIIKSVKRQSYKIQSLLEQVVSRYKKRMKWSKKKSRKIKKNKDVQTQQKQAAWLKREIISAKCKTFHNFVENLDYRKDGSKIYMFVNNIIRSQISETIVHNGKTCTSHKLIAILLNRLFRNSHQIPK